jgi:hypothetical protein
MNGSLLGVLGSHWHWHALHAGWGWPFVGLFWVGLWVVLLGLLFTALWRRRGSWPGGAFSRPGPATGSMVAAMGATAPAGRSLPTGSPDEPLRASTEEREATVRVLSDAMADGRLSSEEHSERVSAAYAARYRHELAGLTADLPGATAPHGLDAAAATPSPSGMAVAPFLPLIVAGLLVATFWAWGFGPPWPLVLLGIWLFLRARRRARRPTLR